MKQEEKVPYNLRMPKKLKARLEKRAREEKRSLNQYIVLTLESIETAKQAEFATASA